MSRPKYIEERPRQPLPAEIVSDLMSVIRNQFYPDSLCGKAAAKTWFQDQAFIRRRVVLWPAAWLTGRGVTLQPQRYKAILLEVFSEIKRHGATDAIKFWPGYLAKCVQERFKHHEEEIYEEGKALRTQLERAMQTAKAAVARQPDPVEALAQAHRVLTGARRPKRMKATADQLSLL